MEVEQPIQVFWAGVSKEGQVTIPAGVLKALDLPEFASVVFRIENGTVIVKKPSMEDVADSAPRLKEPKTWDEIREIVDQDRAEEYRRKMLEGNA
jgi:bifunctional DNA-binding transcriptional regulator/antitoxin component of YhaV-PrlF toxin-antitoxin module